MRRYLKYFISVTLHKYWVFKYCIELKVPLHLAILHDISKFGFEEFFAYAYKFYTKDGSPNLNKNAETAYKFSLALVHHRHRNKHHWQYWCRVESSGKVVPIDIPEVYIREMLADWCGAEVAYNKVATPIEWYEANKKNLVFTVKTRKELEDILYKSFGKD